MLKDVIDAAVNGNDVDPRICAFLMLCWGECSERVLRKDVKSSIEDLLKLSSALDKSITNGVAESKSLYGEHFAYRFEAFLYNLNAKLPRARLLTLTELQQDRTKN